MLKQLFVTNLDYFLDRAMQLDKKHMPEYVGTMEATIEIQSLQIIGFLSMVRNQPALGCRIMQSYFQNSFIRLIKLINYFCP